MKPATTIIRNPYLKRPRPGGGGSGEVVVPASSAPMTKVPPPAAAASSHNDTQSGGMTTAVTTTTTTTTTTAIYSKKLSPAPPPAAATPQESASALVIAAADKAGMEGIDRARIDAIILRESGQSLYMEQQRRRDEKVNERIASFRKKLAAQQTNCPGWEHAVQQQLQSEIRDSLAQRPSRSTAVVVDMDSYYMSCEMLSKPELIHKPACVGRGMILTSNYIARAYGVRSAMAGWIGDKLVEELSEGTEKLIHVPSNFALYKEKSQIVRRVLAEYDPHLKAYSLDEAYMDLAPYLSLKLSKAWTHAQISEALSQSQQGEKSSSTTTDGTSTTTWTEAQAILASFSPSVCLKTADEVLHDMRQAVFDATGGLTCSAGLASNTLLAKIASDRNKPNGQCLVGPHHETDVIPFLFPLSVRKVGGIGRVTEKILHAFGIQTVSEMYERRALIRFLFQPASAASLLRASLGCSSKDGGKDEEDDADGEQTGQKGISRERTFQSGRPWGEVNAKLEDISNLLASDMAGKNLWARTITVKVKLHTFDVLSRSKSLARGVFVRDAQDLLALASEILRGIRRDYSGRQFSVRLLGIRCTNFKTEGDIATGTFKIEDYFRPSTAAGEPQKKSAQRSLDSFFVDAKSAAEKDSDKVNKDGGGVAEPKPTILCPICQQASFHVEDNVRLNRHIDQCLGTSEPTKKKKKRKLSDFWT